MGLAGFGRIGALGLLAALLTGCAAGSPSTVAPEAGDAAVATVATVAPALDPDAPTPTPVMLSDAPTSVPTAPLSASTIPQPSATASGAVGGETASASSATESETGASADADSALRVEFLHGANQAPASLAVAPAADTAGQPAAAPAAPESPEQAAAAAQTGARPPAPPAPTDGMSLVVEGGSNGRNEVAFTFDAGSDTGYAEAILDLLRDEGIRATFGMTGKWASENGALIQRMVAEGHQLINHTWDHASLTGANTGLPPMTYEQLADQLSRTEQVVRDLTGYELKPYFRPPYGDYDAKTLGWLYDLGYPFTIWWTCDTHGWAGWDANTIFETCTKVPLEDEVYLMHVGAAAAGDFEALPLLIDYYRQQGYAFVTVEQMLQP